MKTSLVAKFAPLSSLAPYSSSGHPLLAVAVLEVVLSRVLYDGGKTRRLARRSRPPVGHVYQEHAARLEAERSEVPVEEVYSATEALVAADGLTRDSCWTGYGRPLARHGFSACHGITR